MMRPLNEGRSLNSGDTSFRQNANGRRMIVRRSTKAGV